MIVTLHTAVQHNRTQVHYHFHFNNAERDQGVNQIMPRNIRYLAKGESDLDVTNISDGDDDIDESAVDKFVLRKKESVRRMPAPREPRPYRKGNDQDDGFNTVTGSEDSDAFVPSFKPKLIPRKSVDSLRSSRETIEEMEKDYRTLQTQSHSWVESVTDCSSGSNAPSGDLSMKHRRQCENKENSSSSESRRKQLDDVVKPSAPEKDSLDDDDDVIEIDVLKQVQEREKANGKNNRVERPNVLKDSINHAPSKNKSPALPRKSGRYDDEDELGEHPSDQRKGQQLESTARSSTEWERLVNDMENKNTSALVKPVVPFALQASMTHANRTSGLVRCFILRDRSTTQAQMFPTYELYLEEPTRKLIVVATKMSMNRTSNYHLFDMTRGCAGTKFSKKSGNYLGKLRAHNSQRTQYSLLTNSSNKEEIAGITFESVSTLNFLTEGSQPRKIFAAVPHLDYNKCPIPNKVRDDDDSTSLANIIRKGVFTNRAMCFQNKEPVLENGTYRLNFGGRVTKPSVKNFQLVPIDQPDNIVCQFGKAGEDRFNLDFKAPFCPLQAFSFALCQFNL